MSDAKLMASSGIQMLPLRRMESQLEGLQKLTQQGKSNTPTAQAELENAATQFESMLVGEMVKSMWATVPKEGLLSGSHEEEMYRDMFNDALAQNIAEGPGLGIKRVVIEDMQRLQKRGQ